MEDLVQGSENIYQHVTPAQCINKYSVKVTLNLKSLNSKKYQAFMLLAS